MLRDEAQQSNVAQNAGQAGPVARCDQPDKAERHTPCPPAKDADANKKEVEPKRHRIVVEGYDRRSQGQYKLVLARNTRDTHACADDRRPRSRENAVRKVLTVLAIECPTSPAIQRSMPDRSEARKES